MTSLKIHLRWAFSSKETKHVLKKVDLILFLKKQSIIIRFLCCTLRCSAAWVPPFVHQTNCNAPKGSFTNYIYQFLPIIDHLPSLSWNLWRNSFTAIRKLCRPLTFPVPPMAGYVPSSSCQRSLWTNFSRKCLLPDYRRSHYQGQNHR